MTFDLSVVETVSIMLGMILLAVILRRIGVIEEEHGGLFARLITHLTLPALIFTSLATTEFQPDKLFLALVMLVSQLVCGGLAWWAGCMMRLSRPRKGALILASAFSSSGFLGYAVIRQVFNSDSEALSDAAVVSELGMATVFFTIGVLVAIHFGTVVASGEVKRKAAISFLRSPVFVSVCLGIAASFLDIPSGGAVAGTLMRMLGTISAANTLLVALTIGSMLHFHDLRRVLPIVLLVVLIKLGVQPLLAMVQAEIFSFPELWKQVIVLEAAMPSAALTAVFARRYGCDRDMAGILVFATFATSVFSMLLVGLLLT